MWLAQDISRLVSELEVEPRSVTPSSVLFTRPHYYMGLLHTVVQGSANHIANIMKYFYGSWQ